MRDEAALAEMLAEAERYPPAVAVVLGSGLGDMECDLKNRVRVRFADIPEMPAATAAGHRGEVMLGEWGGIRVLLFLGRLHRYEGHGLDDVLTPLRFAHRLGVRTVVLTNAVGGIRDGFEPGTLVAIRDHLEWTCPFCWRTPGPGGLGGSRPSPYDAATLGVLRKSGAEVAEGVYAQVTGPCYETPAEIRALRAWGADVVGMSTACEAAYAASAGMRVAAISCVTNRAAGLSDKPICHEEVLEVGGRLRVRLAELLERFLRTMGSGSPRSPSRSA